jgi:hypothetical protein
MIRSSLDHFDAAVEYGGSVISCESSIIVTSIKKTIESGRAATFYVTKAQFDAIRQWYWTPERRKRLKVESVSLEEKQKIESELGIKDAGIPYSNRIFTWEHQKVCVQSIGS